MPTYSNVLNEDGFFAIGDTIYQITPNQYKIWKNGDINNYQELIEITETDLSKNIYVYNFNDSQNAIKTRSLFPLYNIDKKLLIILIMIRHFQIIRQMEHAEEF